MSLKKYAPLANYYASVSDTNQINIDRIKVFEPFRPIYEMELLISLYLINYNYYEIKNISLQQPNQKEFNQRLRITEESIYFDISDRFHSLLNTITPIGSIFQQKIQEINTSGRIYAYNSNRIPAYFALERLKVKLILLKKIINKLEKECWVLSIFPKFDSLKKISLESIVFEEFYSRLERYSKIIAPIQISIGKKRSLYNDIVYSRKLEEMCLYISHSKRSYRMNYIMRSIKASLFVCNMIFTYLDIPDPFENNKDNHMINISETLLDPNFIAKTIQSMSEALETKNFLILYDLHNSFNFLMNQVLAGINNAMVMASNSQLHLHIDQTLYYSGNILKF